MPGMLELVLPIFLCISPCFTTVALTDGVPDDLLSLKNAYLPISPDFGLYSQCELPRGSGQQSGICVPATYFGDRMSFCSEFVTYQSCVPPANPIWPLWNLTSKDALIKSLFTQLVSDRSNAEELSLANNGSSTEYLQMRFTGNDACVSDFKRVLCYFNFPQCNTIDTTSATSSFDPFSTASSGMDISNTVSSTYPMCYESCTKYFNQCRFSSSMITSFCQSGSSVWPMLAANIGNLNITPMISEKVGSCTGKNGKHTRSVGFVMIFIVLSAISSVCVL